MNLNFIILDFNVLKAKIKLILVNLTTLYET